MRGSVGWSPGCRCRHRDATRAASTERYNVGRRCRASGSVGWWLSGQCLDRVTHGRVELQGGAGVELFLFEQVANLTDPVGEGKADVLWPSAEEPAPRVAPNGSAVLPSPRETAAGIRIRAALAKPGTPSRETLVVYGFSNEADFERLKPAAGAASADGAAYAADLTSKLQTLPLSRWSRSVVSYVIEPRTR